MTQVLDADGPLACLWSDDPCEAPTRHIVLDRDGLPMSEAELLGAIFNGYELPPAPVDLPAGGLLLIAALGLLLLFRHFHPRGADVHPCCSPCGGARSFSSLPGPGANNAETCGGLQVAVAGVRGCEVPLSLSATQLPAAFADLTAAGASRSRRPFRWRQ